jgi:hypothetical protein
VVQLCLSLLSTSCRFSTMISRLTDQPQSSKRFTTLLITNIWRGEKKPCCITIALTINAFLSSITSINVLKKTMRLICLQSKALYILSTATIIRDATTHKMTIKSTSSTSLKVERKMLLSSGGGLLRETCHTNT